VSLDAEKVAGLVEAELRRVSAPEVVALIRRLLVAPRCELRPWVYGTPNTKYACWIVAEHSLSQTAIAYCDQGFGPRAPWGLLSISGVHMHMGDDSGWFSSLEEAVRDSFAAKDLDAPAS